MTKYTYLCCIVFTAYLPKTPRCPTPWSFWEVNKNDRMIRMDEVTIIAKSDRETKKAAEILAKEVLKTKSTKQAIVIGLEGDLGGGKTTFTQGFAKGLGIKERIISPTFVLLKIFKLKHKIYKHLIHIDVYRLDSSSELKALGWEEFVKDPKNIIIVEWADKVRRILPKKYIQIKFKVTDKNIRELALKIKNGK